ncbi:hypothetical protein GJ744_000156 [Endocarpon pusillum]|uniref:Uncharacterized protein n=1 Tax=Endocarpon pusillum TaxID=364733 RepID=A0A8H7AWR4_9EURO|nr:hypothetical protein GJ744_000156 [Endocarpon pusillum]
MLKELTAASMLMRTSSGEKCAIVLIECDILDLWHSLLATNDEGSFDMTTPVRALFARKIFILPIDGFEQRRFQPSFNL